MSDIHQSELNKTHRDKFLLVMPLPVPLKEISKKIVRSDSSIIGDSLQVSVWGNVLPSITISEKSVPYSGQQLKVSSHARDSYDTISVDFTVDNRFNNYFVIYKWLDMLNNDRDGIVDADNVMGTFAESEFEDGLLDRYQTIYTLYSLDEYNRRVAKFLYHRSFPTSLSQIDYSYREDGQIDASFSFAFSQFEMELLDP